MPTSVEPVNASLSMPRLLDERGAGRAVAGDDVDDAGRKAGLAADIREQERRERRRLGRLQHHGVPARKRRGHLPGQHQQGEVPRDDLAGHPERPRAPVGERVLELVRPARVVEEVRGREREVDVTRLLDRLAAVKRLGHRQLPRALLQDACNPEQILRPLGRPQRRPCVLVRGPGRSHGQVDVLGARLRDLGQGLLVGGRRGGEPPAGAGLDHLATDEEAVALLQADDVAGLGRGSVLPFRHGRQCARRLLQIGHQSTVKWSGDW